MSRGKIGIENTQFAIAHGGRNKSRVIDDFSRWHGVYSLLVVRPGGKVVASIRSSLRMPHMLCMSTYIMPLTHMAF